MAGCSLARRLILRAVLKDGTLGHLNQLNLIKEVAMPAGYYTNYGYMGLVGNRWILFVSYEEYLEVLKGD
jgi:hypothetical protein